MDGVSVHKLNGLSRISQFVRVVCSHLWSATYMFQTYRIDRHQLLKHFNNQIKCVKLVKFLLHWFPVKKYWSRYYELDVIFEFGKRDFETVFCFYSLTNGNCWNYHKARKILKFLQDSIKFWKLKGNFNRCRVQLLNKCICSHSGST